MEKIRYPLFIKQDADGFWALFQNNLANFAWLVVFMMGAGFPADLVFGQMVPGAAVAVAAGNFAYARMAKKLAEREGRLDVTALSYGISTPIQFIYMVVIALAIKGVTKDPYIAWQVAVGACLLGGVILVVGSFAGRQVQKFLPRAAMLGALAGVALTFIAGELFFVTFNHPQIGTLAFAIIILGMIGKASMPYKIPATLVAVVLGTILAFVFGVASFENIRTAGANLGFYFPLPGMTAFTGLALLFGEYSHLLGVIIPISIYNLIETMNNVEAVATMGDVYDVKECQFTDGCGTILGSLFGGILPTTVYIASVGAKDAKAGQGYSILNGVAFLIAATFGLVGAISALIPAAVIAPILVYVGVVMVANSFIRSPHRHAPAVAIAMIPYLANYLGTRFNRGAIDAFPSGASIIHGISPAIMPMAQGAMFTALCWGAVTAFLIDRDYVKAAIMSGTMSILAMFGFMHAPTIRFLGGGLQNQFVIGYVVMTLFFLGYDYMYKKGLIPEGEPVVKEE